MSEQNEPLPPLTRAGYWTVVAGVVFVIAAGVSLWFGEARVFDGCSVKTTELLLDEDDPKAKLVTTERIKSCEPSSLAGGLPLILAIAGGVCLAPGVIRLLPRGKYKAGPVEADTTLGEIAETAKTQADLAAAQFSALSSPLSTAPTDSPVTDEDVAGP